jgi:hypothetical protein
MTDRDLLTGLANDLIAQLEDTDHARVAGLLDAMPARPGERPEELLLDLRVVDDRRLALALALRAGRPFEGLRGVRLDHRLFLYLPLAHARAERICPLLLVGDRLTLASAYPDPDLTPIARRFPNLELDLVISPRDEILAALDRVAQRL